MIILTAILVLFLGWWALHLLELGYRKQDQSLVFAASLVIISIAAICVVHFLLEEIMPVLAR
ncbi:hypothetical protein [Anthocerotibacter panamensis]|uniref:hypothetical protein n=1 Tax=Anthocerotibacter panamensis TaxID=2857077 RepID=UPI001C405023|nr:hypothetical protein [Anthocerotibacter panamensis]